MDVNMSGIVHLLTVSLVARFYNLITRLEQFFYIFNIIDKMLVCSVHLACTQKRGSNLFIYIGLIFS